MTWSAAEVVALRHRLGLDRKGLAQLLAVEPRTVVRWERNEAVPTGSAEAVLFALKETLDRHPARAERTVRFVTEAARVGGLGYLLIKLLDAALDQRERS